jgi:hypothetical protein
MKKFQFAGLLIVMLSGLFISACKDDSDDAGSGSSASSMDVRMTDGAGLYDKVYIDIQGIQVNIEGKGWVDITPTRRGIYNLLDFNNGIDTLIASSAIPAGNVTEVRLILGSNNSVVINGTVWPMQTPSASESGLKVKFHQTIKAGAKCIVWIDFDAHKSIVYNGGYLLKPVIRCFIHSFTGSITGDANPDNAAYFAFAVPATDMNDTFMTFLRSDGTFKLWGLAPGTYSVGFQTKERVTVKTVSGVTVTAGQENNIGVVQIP